MSKNVSAQVSKDAGLWAGYTFNLKYKKKWEFAVNPEIRFNNNLSQLSRVMADIGLEYKPNKTFFAGISYRTSTRVEDDWQDTRERIQFGLGVKHEWRLFTFSFQPRYQASLQQVSSDGDADFETTLRNKLTIKYDINKKLNVSNSFELFNNSTPGMELRLENWRWKGDIGYDINKRNSMSVGYMIQKAIYKSPQEMDFVFLVSYKTELNLSKKAKKEGENPTPVEK